LTRPVRLLLEDIKSGLQAMGADVNSRPVFVLGNQKSGTSPIAGLLAKLTGLSLTMDIRREIERPEIERVRRGEMPFPDYVKKNKLSFSREIVKEPNLTFVYGQLAEVFPDAKYVFVYRDPRENIRSILNRVRAGGDQDALTAEQVRDMTVGWRRIFDGEPVGMRGEHFVETLARRWDAAARVLIDNEGRMIPLRFEDFLQDKDGEIRRLANALALPAKHDIAVHVDFPFQPPGERGVKWLDFFGEKHLKRIEGICGESMARLGYAASNGGNE
jgi:hypothetical protein